MAVRVRSMRPPILFAHGGASANARENTLEAFRLGLRLGASGLETGAWLTVDGSVVLDHRGVIGTGLRKKSIATLERSLLPAHMADLGDLYDECGTGFELALDVRDRGAFTAIVATAARRGGFDRLWVCHPDVEVLSEWRAESLEVRLIHSTRLAGLDHTPERHAALLRERSIDGVNLAHSEWTAGLSTLFHRFGRLCFGWDAEHVRVIATLLNQGLDGVFGDHVDRLVDAAHTLD